MLDFLHNLAVIAIIFAILFGASSAFFWILEKALVKYNKERHRKALCRIAAEEYAFRFHGEVQG